LNWLIWRQDRKQFIVFGIFLVLFAALAIPTGLYFWHVYQHALSTCGPTNTCDQLSNELFTSTLDTNLFTLMKWVMLAIPVLLGLFWGAPLIAKEYAEGTNKLAWTQSVSRRKWVSVKLIWGMVAAAILAGAFSAVATWWSRAGNSLYLDRFTTQSFSSQGIVPVAYVIFAVALGVAIGTWFKQALVALAVTLGALVVIQITVPMLIRPHYESPKVFTSALALNSLGGNPAHPPSPTNGGATWVIGGNLARDGQTINWSDPPKQCIVTDPQLPAGHSFRAAPVGAKPDAVIGVGGGPATSVDCLISLGYQWHVQYQPADRYWEFQWIEVALYLGLTAIAVAATYLLVLRRDA
jgi:ABC-type transport system involved in multi-copper enzyme maturation permease subunit